MTILQRRQCRVYKDWLRSAQYAAAAAHELATGIVIYGG